MDGRSSKRTFQLILITHLSHRHNRIGDCVVVGDDVDVDGVVVGTVLFVRCCLLVYVYRVRGTSRVEKKKKKKRQKENRVRIRRM